MLTPSSLPRFTSGAPLHTQLTAERLNALRDAIVSNEVKPGRGMLLNRTAGGLSVTQRRRYDYIYNRTFYAIASGGTSANVSAGTINNVFYAGGTITSLANGEKIYIDATVDAAGTVTGLTVSKAASVPSSTTTHAYTLLASATVTSGVADIIPVAWNYSQLERCGTGTTYYWGGFGA